MKLSNNETNNLNSNPNNEIKRQNSKGSNINTNRSNIMKSSHSNIKIGILTIKLK